MEAGAFTLTATREIRLTDTLRQPHITYTSAGINMAVGLPEINDGTHDCCAVAKRETRIRQDMGGEKNPQAEMTLYTDGCCYKGDEGNIASYAVVQEVGKEQWITVEAGKVDVSTASGTNSSDQST